MIIFQVTNISIFSFPEEILLDTNTFSISTSSKKIGLLWL